MANWVYGSLAINGPINNVLNFLNNGIEHMHNYNENPPPHNFFLNEDGEIDSYESIGMMYIKGSRRHFVNIDLDDSFEYDHKNGTVSTNFTTEIAWGLDAEVFKTISEFGLLVAAYGDEWGQMFAQSFIYENGEMLKDSYRKLTGEDYEQDYGEEWEWEDENETG